MNDNVLNTQENNQPEVYDDVGSAADALLSRWEDAAEQPSDQAPEEATDIEVEEAYEPDDQETDELDETELDEEDTEIDPEDEEEEAEEENDTEEVEELSDDTLIDILVDGETQQASIKELKRLFGQESSLTRKSQQVAKQRKQAEDAIGKTDVILQKMLEQAEARYKPYADVDMLVASKQMDDADFAQLRKEAQQASEDLKFLREEADSFYSELQQQHQQELQTAAREAVKVLETDIPDWSNQLYDDIRAYAVGQGLPEAQVNNYVDPAVIKILNKARLFDQAKQVTTTKKKRVAKKVLRTKKAPQNEAQVKAKRMQQAKARLQERNADIDDIAEVLLQRWEA